MQKGKEKREKKLKRKSPGRTHLIRAEGGFQFEKNERKVEKRVANWKKG